MRGIKDRISKAREKRRRVKSRVLENYPPPSSKKILHYLTTHRGAKRTEIRDETKLSYSRVYENLAQMEEDGLVESEKVETSKRGDPIKAYSLTFAGLRAALQDYQNQAFSLEGGQDKLEDLALSPRLTRSKTQPVNPPKRKIPEWLIQKMEEEFDEDVSEEKISIKAIGPGISAGPAPPYEYRVSCGEENFLVLNREGTLEFYYENIWQKYGLKNPWTNIESIMKEYPSFFPQPILNNWEYLKDKGVTEILIEKYMETEISMPQGIFRGSYDPFDEEMEAQPRNLSQAWFQHDKKLQLSGLVRFFMNSQDDETLKEKAEEYPDYRLMLVTKENEELRQWILERLKNAEDWYSTLLKDIDSGIEWLEKS